MLTNSSYELNEIVFQDVSFNFTKEVPENHHQFCHFLHGGEPTSWYLFWPKYIELSMNIRWKLLCHKFGWNCYCKCRSTTDLLSAGGASIKLNLIIWIVLLHYALNFRIILNQGLSSEMLMSSWNSYGSPLLSALKTFFIRLKGMVKDIITFKNVLEHLEIFKTLNVENKKNLTEGYDILI